MGKGTVKCRLITTVVAILLSVVELCEASDLSVAAFNVQIFGQKKADDPFIMDILVKIIRRYDIILIQEIRDSSETSIYKLLEKVNEATPTNSFQMEVSPRMGRSSSKEQYAFLFRQNSGLRVENQYIYDDGDEGLNNRSANIIVDTFEREPFIVEFSSTNTELKRFVIGGIHIAPDDAVKEIKALKEVFIDIEQKFGIRDIMIMGDLNADCSYVPKKYWPEISLRSDPSYHWLLGDDVDTTVSNTNCAYDRFIGKGDGFSTAGNGGVVAGSAKVFDFLQEYGLTLEQALDVSDHFPIEFKLKGSSDQSSRLRTAYILNAHVAVSESLNKEGHYFISDRNLEVTTEDGTVVGTLYDGTQRDYDIRMAVKTIIVTNLHKDRIRVEMVRSRKYRGKQLCKIAVRFTNDMYQNVRLVIGQFLLGYGNVIYI